MSLSDRAPSRCQYRVQDGQSLVEVRCAAANEYHPQVLAKFSPAGLLLWCKHCRTSHLLTWRELAESQATVALHP